jgi:hypothetical protein
LPFAEIIARHAQRTAIRMLDNSDVALGVCVFDRAGKLIGHANAVSQI